MHSSYVRVCISITFIGPVDVYVLDISRRPNDLKGILTTFVRQKRPRLIMYDDSRDGFIGVCAEVLCLRSTPYGVCHAGSDELGSSGVISRLPRQIPKYSYIHVV